MLTFFFLGFLGPWGQPVDKSPKKCMSNVPSLFFRFRTAKFRIGTWCLQTFWIFKIAKETGGDKKKTRSWKKRNAPRILFERSTASALWTIACWELSLRCWVHLGSQGAVVWAKYTLFPCFIWGVMPGWNTNSSPKTEGHRNQPKKPNWETREQPLPTGDSIWYGIQFQRWTWEFSQMSSRHLAEEGGKSFEMFMKVFSSLMKLLDFWETDA